MSRLLLLLEDDEALHYALRYFLASKGYGVVSAYTAEQALERLEAGPLPHLIILDLMLPRMNGIEFRAAQQANPAWADIPVIVYSAVDRLGERMLALRPEAWFEKPVDLDALLAAIRRHCRAT